MPSRIGIPISTTGNGSFLASIAASTQRSRGVFTLFIVLGDRGLPPGARELIARRGTAEVTMVTECPAGRGPDVHGRAYRRRTTLVGTVHDRFRTGWPLPPVGR